MKGGAEEEGNRGGGRGAKGEVFRDATSTTHGPLFKYLHSAQPCGDKAREGQGKPGQSRSVLLYLGLGFWVCATACVHECVSLAFLVPY